MRIIIHNISIILPFINEIAILLTNSKLPFFANLYRTCIPHDAVSDIRYSSVLAKICTRRDFRNKIIIDLLAYLGIMLFIGKNTIQYGYVTGVANGMVLIFCSIILPNLFLGMTIHTITKFLKIKSSIFYILIGLMLIGLLMLFTAFMETNVQKITKSIKIDPEVEKNTEK
jgi:hypothetical protein